MAITNVYHLGASRMLTFSLPPDEAVVAAYERHTRKEQRRTDWRDTWMYPKPADHPEYGVTKSGRFHYCGDFTARAVD